MKGYLVLEDGTVFQGRSFGAETERTGEVVFNTSMVGYVKSLTDPSYKGQILCNTFPMQGNYAVSDSWMQSDRIQAEGFLVRSYSDFSWHMKGEKSLSDFLKEHGTPALTGIDTRELTRKLRTHGVMNGIISIGESDPDELLEKVKKAPKMGEEDLVKKVTCKEPFVREPRKQEGKVALVDLGVKRSIISNLVSRGMKVTVFPADTDYKRILDSDPDGLVFSPGPGDPAVLDYVRNTIKKLYDKFPLYGICLGHQVLGLAAGGKTEKLKFGHRGANQPVKDLKKNWVVITSQNHGYVVNAESVSDSFDITHINLNDRTVEGMIHKELPVFTTQFHPEASPGPWDSLYMFDDFVRVVKDNAEKK